ncbi:GntR family transcriptional regulator [Alteromonas sediminis]|uniref:GntR family transcriptional regulator n=1 Tax=Alteromonas sediminis TaxID=2259342 RepID=A0A3N5Y7Z3_9ALTE|nr:GntR family transcriptional regulator [Alteromonas sediminis]RPJ66989.1 GntR family transcriptional regulator [Alteromonas sediminis]
MKKQDVINDIDNAFEKIMDAIVTQTLAPEQKVSESILNESYGISRSISRNLMERLISKQILVDVSPRITKVSPLRLHDIRQNFLLRKMLIPSVFGIAASNVNIDEISELASMLHEELEVENDDIALQKLKVNKDLNLIIARHSEFPLMVDFVQQLEYIAMRVYWIYIKSKAAFPFSQDQHLKIFEAMQSRDTAHVKATVLDLLTQTEETIMNAILTDEKLINQSLIVRSKS